MLDEIDYQEEDLYIKHYSEVENYSIGKDIDEFFSSPKGKWLIEQISSDERSSKDKLADVDPGDKEQIAKLQDDIKVCTRAVRYLIFKLREFKHLESKKE